jgi:hypothetical protein
MKGAIMAPSAAKTEATEAAQTVIDETTSQDLEQLSEQVTSDTSRRDIASLQAGGAGVYSSIEGAEFEDRLKVAAAVANSVPLNEHINKTIQLRHFVAQATEIVDRESKTGELLPVVRLILIDEDGTAYHAISGGLFKSIENLIGILGKPAYWPGAVPVKVAQEGTPGRKYFTLKFA